MWLKYCFVEVVRFTDQQ